MDIAAKARQGERASAAGAWAGLTPVAHSPTVSSPSSSQLSASQPPSPTLSTRDRSLCLVFAERFENQLPQPLLSLRIGTGRTQEREASLVAIDGVVAGGEGNIAASASAALPHSKANELQALQAAVGEM